MRLPVLALALLLALPTGFPGSPTARTTPTLTAAQAPDSVRHLALGFRPWSTAVAVTLSLPFGSGDDPEGLEGAAWLLALTVQEQVSEVLASVAATVSADVEAHRTRFVLLSVTDEWVPAYRALSRVLFGHELSPEIVSGVRGRLAGQLGFEAGAPVRQFELEMARFLYGAAHPWARPPRGTRETISNIGIGTLSSLARDRFRPANVTGAVVGPVEESDVTAVLSSALTVRAGQGGGATPATGAPGIPPGVSAAPPSPSPGREAVGSDGMDGALAWTTPDRLVITQDVTSSWITVAFPLPAGVPLTRLEFLRHVVYERLAPDPPDPGLFSARVSVQDLPGGPGLVIVLAVSPEESSKWERRVLGTLISLSNELVATPFFRTYRRRFRSDVVLRLSAPEAEATRLVGDLEWGGTRRDIEAEIWELTRDGLRETASALGPPRVLLYGPDLSDRQGS